MFIILLIILFKKTKYYFNIKPNRSKDWHAESTIDLIIEK